MLYPLSYWGASSSAVAGNGTSGVRPAAAPAATPQLYPTVRVPPNAMIIATFRPHRPSVRERRLTVIPPSRPRGALRSGAASTMGATARPMIGPGQIKNSEVAKC